MTTLAIIPARGGSKGIKNKNLALLAGQPLLYYSIAAAKASGIFDAIVVTSDSADILAYATSQGVTPIERPFVLAGDMSPTEPVLEHAINTLAKQGHQFDHAVLLQPTSPLRSAEHIAHAHAQYCEAFNADQCAMLVSVMEPDNHPLKAYKLDQHGNLVGAYGPDTPYQPRQSLDRCYYANGAIYIFGVEAFMAQGGFPKAQVKPFVMAAQDSVDIDTPEDLVRVAQLLTARGLTD